MRDINFIESLHATDLVMYQYGTEKCSPGHFYGPAVRDYYLIHYIHEGCGIFQVGGVTYHLQKGEGFLICPNIITYYEADQENPWEYSWVGFQGLKAEIYLQQARLTAEHPIFRYDQDNFLQDCFEQMIATKNFVKSHEIRLIGYLHLLLSQLIETAKDYKHPIDNHELYVQKAVEMIVKNFSGKLLINHIADAVGLNRSYLCLLFKDKLGISPQQYLIQYRIEKACEFLQNPELSIGDVARSVGYEDPLLFSKVFRKIKGTSPREYRRWSPLS